MLLENVSRKELNKEKYNMKKMQHGQIATWKVQHAKIATSEKCNKEQVRGERVQPEKGAT